MLYAALGSAYWILETRMHIPPIWADCLFYLYGSGEEAEAGSREGGTGFLVHCLSTVEGWVHIYAVTNKHVIDEGFCALRLNRKVGGTDPISTQPEQWIFHPDGDDLAVFPVTLSYDVNWWSISTAKFISHETIEVYHIGYGEDVFLVGRLIAHAGKRKNTPVVRFGNISLMADPDEKLEYRDSRGNPRKQEAFLVECRSLSGFSGSPVFVTTNQTYTGDEAQRVVMARQKEMGYIPTPEEGAKFKPVSMSGTQGPWLLGVDSGHLPLWRPVFKKDEKTETEFRVDANTGIAGVIPAWRLLELLEVDKLTKQRAREDKKIAKQAVNKKRAT